jgi:hypothetical protein
MCLLSGAQIILDRPELPSINLNFHSGWFMEKICVVTFLRLEHNIYLLSGDHLIS